MILKELNTPDNEERLQWTPRARKDHKELLQAPEWTIWKKWSHSELEQEELHLKTTHKC